jgi:hypothetical protein
MISHEADMPPDLIDGFVVSCRALGIQPHVEKKPKSVFSAAEDYIPTAIVVFLAKPFFDAFLKKAGEDAYGAFKKAFVSLLKKASALKMIVFASAEKKFDPQYPFSRVVSIYSKSPEGITMKFLFFAEGDDEYFSAATESLCDILRSGSLPRADHRPMGGIYILYYDRKSKVWTYKARK